MFDENIRFECDALIAEVEKRPGIYDRFHPDYRKEEKERLWLEICGEIIPEWNELSTPEKNSKILLVQRKWKNLRDSFRKELNILKQIKSPRYMKKKREYLYFKSMQFLEPFLRESEAAGKRTPPHKAEQYEEQSSSDIMKFESEDYQYNDSSIIHRPKIRAKKRSNETSNSENWDDSQNGDNDDVSTTQKTRNKTKQSSNETPILEMWESSENEDLNDDNNYIFHNDIDEDRYFLLSLLPSLRNLPSQKKLSVRVEFLQILQRISFSISEEDPLRTS